MSTRTHDARGHRSATLSHLAEATAFWTQLSMLQLFGPATQDFERDPIAQLKRRHGRALRPWDEGTGTPAEARADAVLTIQEAPTECLPQVWERMRVQWGDEASEIWLEAFAADDASQT